MCEIIHGGNAAMELSRCVRQVGLLSIAGVDSWEEFSSVREDREELTSGVPAVMPMASSGSYVGNG